MGVYVYVRVCVPLLKNMRFDLQKHPLSAFTLSLSYTHTHTHTKQVFDVRSEAAEMQVNQVRGEKQKE